MKKQQVNTVSLGYKRLPVEAVPPYAGWIAGIDIREIKPSAPLKNC
jgi:hypothetical protein